MITTKELLELGFKKESEETCDYDECFNTITDYWYELDLYHEEECYLEMSTYWNENEDNNEWIVHIELVDTELEFTDIKELKSFMEIVKRNLVKPKLANK